MGRKERVDKDNTHLSKVTSREEWEASTASLFERERERESKREQEIEKER